MVEASREVLFRFKGTVDPSIRKSLREVAQEAAKTSQAQTKAETQRARVAQQAAREHTQMQAAQNKRTISILKQQEREAIASAKNQQRAQAEANKRTIGILKQQEREAVNAARTHESAQRSVIRNEKILQRSLMGTVSGTLDLTRGLLLMGLAGEKNTEKILEGLIKIEATFALLRGGIQVIQAATRAWGAYAAAVSAASVVQATAGAGKAGSLGRGVAEGVGVGVGASLARRGRLGWQGHGHTGAPVVAGAALFRGGFEMLGAENVSTMETGVSRIMPSWMRAKHLQQRIEAEDKFAKMEKQRTAADKNAEWLADQKSYAQAQARIGMKFRLDTGMTTPGQEWGAAKASGDLDAQTDLLERQKGILESHLDTQKEIGRERVRGAMEELRASQQTLKTVQEQLKAVREQYMSAKEKFGLADPMQQQRLIAINRKAQRFGVQALNREELTDIGGMGLDSTSAVMRQGAFGLADRAGFDREFAGAERNKAQALAGAERQLQGRIQAGVDVGGNVRVTLDSNVDAVARSLSDRVAALVAPRLRAVAEEAARLTSEKLANERDFRTGRQKAGAGG